MTHAKIIRETLADILGGTIGDGDRSDKQFVNTYQGQFRIRKDSRTDNSTEVAAHKGLGVTNINLLNDKSRRAFFTLHNIDPDVGDTLLLNALSRRRTEL